MDNVSNGLRPTDRSADDPSRRTLFQRAQSTRAGALLLSWDFAVGLVVGIGLGLLVALVPALQVNGFAFMITLCGIGAGVAALVLAPMAMLLSSISPEFHQLIERVEGGIAGVLLPFKQVAIVAVGASVTSLVVAVLAPLSTTTEWWAIWIAASVPIVLLVWSVAGCVQVTSYVIGMIEKDRRVRKLAGRMQQAKPGSGEHAA
ncbi:hypothetical protein [Leifsonia sp. PS1209]|uniref:hypothetical protein n=1 Tax=Leifsonia sp. PS1209 TaxID=2724914 RepID=UPI001442CB55|nr:hypothetical protein [Leifsonia sp. PS1209]QIZ98636.1 hypothetical protein HF024_09050 [Leifsonia sp. PS1209]